MCGPRPIPITWRRRASSSRRSSRPHYLVREIAVIDREPGSVELAATLAANAADPAELDRLTARLETAAFIQHASWSLRSPE